jgi:hypothetical protein
LPTEAEAVRTIFTRYLELGSVRALAEDLDRLGIRDVQAGTIDIVLVYKVDRLTRSLADFAKLIELFDAYNVSLVSVTRSFNTSCPQRPDCVAEDAVLIEPVSVA